MARQYFSVEALGDKMLVRQDGRDFIEGSFHPVLFEPCHGDVGYKDIFGKNLKPVVQETMKGAREYMRNRAALSNGDTYGNHNFHIQYLNEHHTAEYDFDKIRIFFIDIEVLSVDEDGNPGAFPDPQKALYPVTFISLYDSQTGWHQWGLKDYTPDSDAQYYQFEYEEDLLVDFLKFWKRNCPHVLTSWNGDTFDVPYLLNRTKKEVSKTAINDFSPFGKVREKTINDGFGNDVTTYHIYGVQQLDYLALYKEFTYTMRANYRLDTIGEIECGIGKVDFGEFKNFLELYVGDHQLYGDYCRQDVNIILELNKKLRLLELAIEIAYEARINYSDVFSSVRLWDATIYHRLMEENVVVPIPKTGEDKEYPGGYVKHPPKGMNKWILSFDLASLYPSIIRGWNLGMETIKDTCQERFDHDDAIEWTLSKNYIKQHKARRDGAGVSRAANGYLYDNNEQSLYSKLMEENYNRRKAVKREMLDCKKELEVLKADDASDDVIKAMETKISILDTRQMGIKIKINSFYGILANKYFRFFDVRIAESITMNGQMSLRFIMGRVNLYLNDLFNSNDADYCIYGDTDSIYVNVEAFVDKLLVKRPDSTTEEIVDYLDKVGLKLNKFIDMAYQELKAMLNLREHMLIMDREGIFGNGVWTAKKRYLLLCYDMEGVRYAEPQLKIQGLETQRSSTPTIFKKKLKEMYKVIVTKDNDYLIGAIADFRKEINDITLNDIAFPSGVNGINKYQVDGYPIKGTPGHVRAAISYNRIISESPELKTKYPLLRDGDKLLTVLLKDPNIVGEKAFAYVYDFPMESGVYKYIDREAMMEKGFLKPLKAVLDVIGWDVEKKASLDAFF